MTGTASEGVAALPRKRRRLGAALGLIAALLLSACGVPAASLAPAPEAPGARGALDGEPAVEARLLSVERSSPPPAADTAAPTPLVTAGSDLALDEFFVHVPPHIDQQLVVLVALHGMEGNGPAFAQPLRARADREGWLLVAPTFRYGDWQDPAQLIREECGGFIPRLHAFLNELPARTGLDLAPQIVIFGASRGAQLAHRFAFVYPEQTRALALMAGGTWTLPQREIATEHDTRPLPYPFGVGDLRERFGRDLDLAALRQVVFWVGVGANDNDPRDVPHQWDPLLGDNRLARAQTFVRRLVELGAHAELTVFPNVGHTLTDEMRARALDFLATAS
ncbi:MAG TPA: hypothetical protein VKZ60_17005 [Chloroflexota bacterium]|jgi:pimeloyl-ACP methyl ester carboxylesterase|nr:hypothetical protein [Chloroflexota bacterium]